MMGQRRPGLPIFLATLAALALAACDRPRPIQARPALFAVTDADTTIWLFGTIHLMPDNVRWSSPALDRAVAESDLLVTEIPDAQLQGGAETFDAMTIARGLPPALSRVAPAQRRALLRAIDAANLTLAEADHLKSWALATIIASSGARAAEASRGPAPETRLAEQFREQGKPQRAFESLAGQLALFDRLPEADQRVVLANAVRDAGHADADYRAELDAWVRGDTARIAATSDATFGGDKLLEQTLLTARNRRWAWWIAGRMRQPGKVLVAVGAGHLAGTNSVIAMLRAWGLKVRRVQ